MHSIVQERLTQLTRRHLFKTAGAGLGAAALSSLLTKDGSLFANESAPAEKPAIGGLPELPHFDNSGYLLDVAGTVVFHPGDALTVPPRTPDLLLLPVSAPWLKVSECIDYARSVGAPRSLAIHDAVYSEAGLGIVDGHLRRFLEPHGQDYVRLASGEDLA